MNIHRASLLALAGLLASTAAQADVLTFVCMGKESHYPKAIEGPEDKIVEKPTTVHVEIDRQKKTLTMRGTALADGNGPATLSPTKYEASYPKTITILGVTYKHVFVTLPQNSNRMSVIASTHLQFDAPEWEGRSLFSGICRPPTQKS
jgi:hypothetical protein